MNGAGLITEKWKNHQLDLNGVRISEHAEMGRILVATRDFSIGDIIMIEKPLIVFSDYDDLLLTFSMLPDSKKEEYLDMQHLHSPDDAIHSQCKTEMSKVYSVAKQLSSSIMPTLSNDYIFRILAVANFNSHMYTGCKVTQLNDLVSSQEKSALFSMGSKVAHSCSPNCQYSSRFMEGCLAYFCLKPILAGQMLTYSYVETSLGTTERRDLLLRSKDFFCCCSVCIGLNLSTGLPCDIGSCIGFKVEQYGENELSSFWQCLACGSNSFPLEKLNHLVSLEADLQRMEKTYVSRNLVPQTIISMTNLYDEIMKNRLLAPTHAFMIKLNLELAKLYASVAADCEQNSFLLLSTGMSSQNRIQSACCLFTAAQITECVEFNCLDACSTSTNSSDHCSNNHLPSTNSVINVLWACLDWIKSGYETQLPIYVAKYIAILERTYGNNDADLSFIKMYIQSKGYTSMSISQAVNAALKTNSFSNAKSSHKTITNNVSTILGCHNSSCPNSPLTDTELKKLKLCGRCKLAAYCSPECQKQDWKNHKKSCQSADV